MIRQTRQGKGDHVYVVRHQTAGSFLAHAQAVLEQHEAANNLMIGIAVRLHEFPDRIKTPPYLATVEDGDRLLAAAVMTPPHRVILYAGGDDPEALRLLAQDLQRGRLARAGCRRDQANSQGRLPRSGPL